MRRKRKINRIHVAAAVPVFQPYALLFAAFYFPRFRNSEIAQFQILRRIKIVYESKIQRFFRSVRKQYARIVIIYFYGKPAKMEPHRTPLLRKQLREIFMLVATERAFSVPEFRNRLYRIFSVFAETAIVLQYYGRLPYDAIAKFPESFSVKIRCRCEAYT